MKAFCLQNRYSVAGESTAHVSDPAVFTGASWVLNWANFVEESKSDDENTS